MSSRANPAGVPVGQLVQQLGVQWTREEAERRLFALCTQVQAALWQRHPDTYRTPAVHLVPTAYVDEAKEVLLALFSQAC